MYLTTETQNICRLLGESERLYDTRILQAYPFEYQPTKPRHAVICVSPDGADYNACSLGQSGFQGSYRIALDFFVPQRFGSPVTQDILEDALCAVRDTGVSRIQTGKIQSDNELGCFTVSCILTYPSVLYLTEEKLWTPTREQ